MTYKNQQSKLITTVAVLSMYSSCGINGKLSPDDSASSRALKSNESESSESAERTEADVGEVILDELALDGSKCPAKGNSQRYESIGSVMIDTLPKLGGSEFIDNKPTPTAQQIRPRKYKMTLTPKFNFNLKNKTPQVFDEFWSVWIDSNSDGRFSDSERILNGKSLGIKSLVHDITIPDSPGKKTMRVAMRWGAAPSGCGTFSFGEVKDYSLDILPTNSLIQATGRLVVSPNLAQSGVKLDQVAAIGVSVYGKGCKGEVCWSYRSPEGLRYKPADIIKFENLNPGTYNINVKLLKACPAIPKGQTYIDCAGVELKSSTFSAQVLSSAETTVLAPYKSVSTNAEQYVIALSPNPPIVSGGVSSNPPIVSGGVSSNPPQAIGAVSSNPPQAIGGVSSNPAMEIGGVSSNPPMEIGGVSSNPPIISGGSPGNP